MSLVENIFSYYYLYVIATTITSISIYLSFAVCFKFSANRAYPHYVEKKIEAQNT